VVHRLGVAIYFAIGAKTHPNFENWRYFRKNHYRRSQVAECAVFSIILSSKCTIQNSFIKSVFEHNFYHSRYCPFNSAFHIFQKKPEPPPPAEDDGTTTENKGGEGGSEGDGGGSGGGMMDTLGKKNSLEAAIGAAKSGGTKEGDDQENLLDKVVTTVKKEVGGMF
jgi:hypothetical protein